MGNIVMFPTHKARKPKVKVNKQTEEEAKKIKENIFAEIYHPEELEYRKIWARCKVVKRQFFNPERRNKVPADLYE